MEIKEIELQSEVNRRRLMEIVYKAKAGHIGGDLSCLNVLTALYFDVMKTFPHDVTNPSRDRLVMSKGHCVEALYVTLESKGYIQKELTDTLGQFGSILAGHPTIEVPGIEVNSGALTGWFLENRSTSIKVLFVPYYFFIMNLSVVLGFMRYLKKSQTVNWERAKRAA